MALFKKKTEQVKETLVKKDLSAMPDGRQAQAEEVVSEKTTSKKEPALVVPKNSSRILKAPRITEKATFAAENGIYVFEIDLRATKKDVAGAVESLYKVKPVKVNITKIPSKSVQSRRRGKFGTTSKGKKAYVYLKKGDTIEIV